MKSLKSDDFKFFPFTLLEKKPKSQKKTFDQVPTISVSTMAVQKLPCQQTVTPGLADLGAYLEDEDNNEKEEQAAENLTKSKEIHFFCTDIDANSEMSLPAKPERSRPGRKRLPKDQKHKKVNKILGAAPQKKVIKRDGDRNPMVTEQIMQKSAFRRFTKFITIDFNINKRLRKVKDRAEMLIEIRDYIDSRFNGLLKALGPEADDFLNDLVYIIFTNRREKKNKYPYLPSEKDEGWDTIVEANTGWSRVTQDAFLEKPAYAFFCIWFCLASDSGKSFIEDQFKKFQNLGQVQAFLTLLGKRAVRRLKASDTELSRKLLAYAMQHQFIQSKRF